MPAKDAGGVAIADDRLYTVNEACEILRLCRTSLYYEIRAGHLQHVSAGKRKRFTGRQLRWYISGRRGQGRRCAHG